MSQVWFVTGSSRGLGFAIVEEALRAGNKVIATARNTDALLHLERKYSNSILVLRLDVTDVDKVTATVRAAERQVGPIDVVVNNAACVEVAPIEDIKNDDFRSQIDTNFFGAVNITQAILPFFRKRRSGHFLQISSIASRGHYKPGVSAYMSAKAALEAFSGCLAAEVKPFGIKVTIVEPSAMRTEMTTLSRISAPNEDYDSAMEQVIEHFVARSGSEKIDPIKVARALLRVTHQENPPLKLLLGSEASAYAAQLSAQQTEEDAKYTDITEAVDF
jgi:NAD(P)-dependent dehydrogenase (short-subunit alcohol dehydrogenase family)